MTSLEFESSVDNKQDNKNENNNTDENENNDNNQNVEGHVYQVRTENKIYENERDYYISRLQKRISKLQRALLFALIISIIDIAAIFFYPDFFKYLANFILIIVYIIWIFICFGFFCHSYTVNDDIGIKTYKKVKVCLYISLSLSIIITINIFYFLITRLVLKSQYWINLINNKGSFNEIIVYIVAIFIYVLLNILNPFHLVHKFFKVKKTLKSFGTSLGQDYSITYTVAYPGAKGLGLENVDRKVEFQQ